jgi:sigma-B regulation protein RsbU (phosphoserine phosphatase)
MSGIVAIFAADSQSPDIGADLRAAGYDVAVRALHDSPVAMPAQLLIVDGARQTDHALKACQRLRVFQAEHFAPILFLGADGADGRLSGLQSGADTFLPRPFGPAELLAQVQALIRIKDRHDQLALRAAEASRVSQRLQKANQQMDQELELARRLQESFLPQTLPQLPRVRFAVKYKPCAQVGGDFYDVFRLDEHHVGFYVADAMGHGVPASLLTIFVKKGVRAKEINGQNYRLVPPPEVLGRLNKDLIEQHIPELPFITMAYMLLNCSTGAIEFSRAGHPHPIHVPRDGKPALWQLEGSLLGVFDTRFRVQPQELNPGDKLLLYTDGMDAASFEQHPVGLASLLAAIERFRALPIGELVERLSSDLFTQTKQSDDLTVFGAEMLES